MSNHFDQFLNRKDEIKVFTDLLSHLPHRILLLYGAEGAGKSWLVHQLRRLCAEAEMVSTLVDFRRHKTSLAEPEWVIRRLRERLGGSFAEQMGQVEAEIQRDFAMVPVMQAARSGAALSGTTRAGGGNGGLYIADSASVQVGGNLVGRDQYIFPNATVVFADGGRDRAVEESGTRRNTALRAALQQFQANQKVILFFDHFEDATGPVASWLYNHVLDLHLSEMGAFPNLWLVVSGRKVPLQDEVEAWRHILHDQEIGPIPDEDIYLFWVGQHGIDRTIVNTFIRGSQRNTRLLFLTLKNYAGSAGAEQADG